MTPYPLHRSEKSTKVMITLFLIFMLVSFTVAFLNVYDKVGRVPNGVVLRYGPEQTELNSTAPSVSNDGIYGGDTESAPAMVARINTFSALLDLTHPHIFELPIVMLVLCHFLMRTRLASWAKVLTYFFSFGGVASLLATPWLVRFVSIKLALLLWPSVFLLGIATIVNIVVPIWDMWAMPSRHPEKP